MGEARRRKASGEPVSWCRTCTLCCVLPEILSLDKPMYKPCRHIARSRCGIYGQPERPDACSAYACAYLQARMNGGSGRNRIPHPLEAGAYFHIDQQENAVVMFVDPAKAERWKTTQIAEILRTLMARGLHLVILDRGRRMVVKSEFVYDEILKRDMIAFADAEGRPKDIAEYDIYASGVQASG